jgi:hypothetical protein
MRRANARLAGKANKRKAKQPVAPEAGDAKPPEVAASGLVWKAMCALDHGGSDDEPYIFEADYGRGRYWIDVSLRHRHVADGVVASRRFSARWVVDRSLITDDNTTPSSNVVRLKTYASSEEAKQACLSHSKTAAHHRRAKMRR